MWHHCDTHILSFFKKLFPPGKLSKLGMFLEGLTHLWLKTASVFALAAQGCRCGVTGWAWPYTWWSQGEAQWSMLLSGDLLMRFAECKLILTPHIPNWRKTTMWGWPGVSQQHRLSGRLAAVPQDRLVPSCSLPVALPGDLCLGCADSESCPNPGSQTSQ